MKLIIAIPTRLKLDFQLVFFFQKKNEEYEILRFLLFF